MLSSAVINWPLKCLAFYGAEVIFQWLRSVWNQNKISFYIFGSNTSMAGLEKSQYMWTINARDAGVCTRWKLSSGRQNGLPFSTRHRTTIVALVKATKNKATLATDEVHMENWNHGLAWTDSGNNRTVTRLLIKANSKVVLSYHYLKSNLDNAILKVESILRFLDL